MAAKIISNVITQGRLLASHSWEYRTLSEALLEWYNPEISVFSKDAFLNGQIPVPVLDVRTTQSLSYAITNIRTNYMTLVDGDGRWTAIYIKTRPVITNILRLQVLPVTQLLSGPQPSLLPKYSLNI